MAEQEPQLLDQPIQPTTRQSVLDVLREQRAQNPNYTKDLVHHLWESLSPEERDFRMQVVKDELSANGEIIVPEEYLAVVGTISRTMLLLEYGQDQVRISEELRAQFQASPDIPAA